MLPRHIIAYILIFFVHEFVQLQQRQLLLLLCQWRLCAAYSEVRIFHIHRFIAAQIWLNNFGRLPTQIVRLKKRRSNFLNRHFPSNHCVYISVRFHTWQKFVLPRGRTAASLKFRQPGQNLEVNNIRRTCLRELATDFFRKITKNLPSASRQFDQKYWTGHKKNRALWASFRKINKRYYFHFSNPFILINNKPSLNLYNLYYKTRKCFVICIINSLRSKIIENHKNALFR